MVRVRRCRVIPAGANAVRNSDGVRADLLARAEAIASRADAATPHEERENENYYTHVRRGAQRASAVVVTGNDVSARASAYHNTLLKALDAGR